MGQPGLQDAVYPQYAVSAKRPLPPTVHRAVLFMRIGAALAVANGLVMIVLAGQANNGSQAVDGGSSASTAAFEAGYIVGYLVWFLALAGLWLWMAQANKAGKNWARITGTTFFGVSCLVVLVNLVADLAGAGQDGGLAFVALAVTGLNWIIGLFAVVLLWHKKSALHFRSFPVPYPAPGPLYYPVPQSNTTMDGIAKGEPVTDPWSTPSSQA